MMDGYPGGDLALLLTTRHIAIVICKHESMCNRKLICMGDGDSREAIGGSKHKSFAVNRVKPNQIIRM